MCYLSAVVVKPLSSYKPSLEHLIQLQGLLICHINKTISSTSLYGSYNNI